LLYSKKADKTFIKYISVGIVNTLFGYGVIFLCLYIGITAEISNFFGYVVGFFISYLLNKKYSFKSKARYYKDLPKFFIGMAIAYVSNFIVLILLYRLLEVNKYTSQICAGIVYTLVGYVLSKFWIFREVDNDSL